MRTLTLFALGGLLASCVPSETGIDRTRVAGQVHIPPVLIEEGVEEDNDARGGAIAMELTPAVHVISGVIASSDAIEAGTPSQDADKDWFSFISKTEFDTDFELRIPGATDETEVYLQVFDSSVVHEAPASCGADLSACLTDGTLTNEECNEAFAECTAAPRNFDRIDERFVTEGKARIQFTAEAGVQYFINLGGIAGADNEPYTLILKGLDPNETEIVIGAFPSADVSNRGNPLGGTTALEFTLGPDWTWQADYEMLYLRRTDTETCDAKDEDLDGMVDEGLDCGVFIVEGEACDGLDNDGDEIADEGFEDLIEEGEEDPSCGLLAANNQMPSETLTNEAVQRAFLFAGSWNSLNDALPAGTWYSLLPVEISLTAFHVEQTVQVETALSIDTVAPLVIGWEQDEVEPNDMTADSSVPSIDQESGTAQDIGNLSGPGFVDYIRGGIVYDGNPDTWDADVDVFKFQVTEPTTLLFTLDWAEPVDLDILILDEENEVFGLGYFNQPESNEYPDEVYVPGTDYFIAVMIWTSADDPGTSYDWELALEQNPG